SHFIYKITKKIPMPNKTRMKIISNGARDNARRPMQWNDSKFGGFSSVEPWQCVNPDYEKVNVALDLNSPDSIYRFYQQLLSLKKGNQTLIYGNIKEYNREDKNTVSYLRFDENNKILVLGNFKKKEVLYKIPEELLNKEYQVLISNYNELNIKNGYIVLKPYEAMAISISNYKKELSYGAVIYSEKNGKREFLLEKMGLGHTSLPKGHIEKGETPIECVKREIREELGINDIEIDSTFSNTITYSPKLNVIKDVVFYTAKVDRDVKITIDNKEVVAYEWKEYNDALASLTHDSDKETLTKHNNYLNGEK
ncbi:MAG: NUDIX domain-containing protein, partial [Gammaproteobacteria bacterium]|nr:NUDIX domain-containing protein [Gammaproteobacteria bacterium]